MGSSKIFKCGFDIEDYKGILPSVEDYLQNDFIINFDEHKKGNVENCVWKKYKPSIDEINSPEFKKLEAKRILKTGAWACIKEEIVWIPPNYYFALNYVNPAGNNMEFRLQRLMHVYFKIRARNTPHCKGTMTIKARQTGETTMVMSDAFWETFEMEEGQVTINSKTRSDAQNPCWKTMQAIYMGIPRWMFEMFFGDCDHNGRNIAETIKFLRFADETRGITPKNVLLAYYPSVYNALDGKNSVKKAIGDEFLKWVECNFGDWFNNASKFIMPGFQRSGLFDLISSPPEKDNQSFRDGYELHLKSDPNNLDENGTTESRIHEYYINPLHGIQGSYDKFGDADPEKIYDWIMRERKRQPKDKLLEEIRGFPLNDEEIWGSMEGGKQWANHEGISERKIYLLGTRFKDNITKEPCRVYGNLEREELYIDGDVRFRMSDLDKFDLKEARFCFSYLPQNKEPLKNIFKPPQYVEGCLGVDPFNNRYPAKHIGKQSNGAMVNRVFRDVLDRGYNKCPTMIYCCRPSHQEIFFEDILNAAIFNRSYIQYENRSDKFSNYAEDRGYWSWLLPEIGEPINSNRKGDAPSGGKNAFLDIGIGLIDENTNTPLHPDDQYYLEYHWFIDLLEGYLKFNSLDTHESDLVMADIQSLVGCIKILKKKIRQPSTISTGIFDYLLN